MSVPDGVYFSGMAVTKSARALTGITPAQHTYGHEGQQKAKLKTHGSGPGRAGCEALMFVVRDYHPGTPVTDENLKLNPKDTLRICAEDIHEVMQHLKRWEPNFDIPVNLLHGPGGAAERIALSP
jgi:hypothetical protein